MRHLIENVNLIDFEKYDAIIIDKIVKELHFPDLKDVIEIENPEKQKSFDGFQKLSEKLLERKLNRNSHILAIGGGALSDLVGFVASTVKRGVSFDIVPTTLLAMVDAAIGGKTAINTEAGKNQIGTFYFPKKVMINLDFLKTLPEDEIQSGLGEVLKYTFLDEDIFQMAKHGLTSELIQKCAEFKMNLVEKDPNEKNERMFLNLGHTFGHAFEKIEEISHGIAVIKGLFYVLKVFNPSLLDNFDKMTLKLNLNFEYKFNGDVDLFRKLIKNDKKNTTETVNFVIPQNIGKIKIEAVSYENLDRIIDNELFRN